MSEEATTTAKSAIRASMRRGLSTGIEGEPAGSRRGVIHVKPELEAKPKGETQYLISAKQPEEMRVELYGPGDVRGFDSRVVVRTDPKFDPEIGDFEPNYFPMIEFAEPDFAWRYSPEGLDSNGNLRPWITLIALKEDEFEDGARGDDQLPWITVKNSAPLPDLDQAAYWAHLHIAADAEELESDTDMEERIVRHERDRVVCRLLCPTHLEPKGRYTAFVIPTFELGRCAGLGLKPGDDIVANTPAWDILARPRDLELPYYFKWSFGTGLRGDFEYAVRLLKLQDPADGVGYRALDCSNPGYGMPSVNREKADPGEAHLVDMEGALVPIHDETEPDSYEPKEPDVDFRKALARLLNREIVIEGVGSPFFTRVTASVNEWGTVVRISWQLAKEATCVLEYDTTENLSSATEVELAARNEAHSVELAQTSRADFTESAPHTASFCRIILPSPTQINPGETIYFRISATETGNGSTSYHTNILRFDVPTVLTVLPPVYGRWHAARSFIDCPEPSDKPWFHQLNVDPRYRSAAGLGALVVQKQQNALMASAWEQLGAIAAANDLVRRAQLGRALSGSIHDRLSSLGLDDFLQITGPVHKRTRLNRCSDLYNKETMGITPYVHFRDKTDVPDAVFDPAFRRIARPRGPFRKQQVGGDPGQGDFVQKICNGRFLFSVGLEYQEDLEAEELSEERSEAFWREFESHGITLFHDLTIEQVEPGKWRIKENDSGRTHIVSRQDEALNVYGKLRAAGPHHEPEGTLSIPASSFLDVRCDGRVEPLLGEPDGAQCPKEPTEEEPVVVTPPAPLEDVRKATSCALSPENTICDRTRQQIELSGDSEGKCFERIMAYPKFPQPMYKALKEISQDLLIPGLEKISQNSITLLKSNRSFIESFMVGLNHELARELLWREYPTDQRGSYARQFWDPSDNLPHKDMRDDMERWQERLKDIQPLDEWDDRLGEHRVPFKKDDGEPPVDEEPIEEKVVLVIRGDLLKKHPNTRIYAIPATTDEGGEPIPYLQEFAEQFDSGVGTDPDDYPEPVTPVFSGQLEPDITFLGFPFTESDARSAPVPNGDAADDGTGTPDDGDDSRSDANGGMGYFFVFEERPMEIRFGLDVEASPPANQPDCLSNVAWNQVGRVEDREYGYISMLNRIVQAESCEDPADRGVWDSTLSSARIASITLQKAFRMSVHADRLIEA